MKHFTSRHKTKYLKKCSQTRSRVRVRLNSVTGRIQKCCEYCFTVHAQHVGSHLAFYNSPKCSQRLLSFFREPRSGPTLNFLLQGLDNVINLLLIPVRKCFPNDTFEFIPGWHTIFFT